MNETIDGLLEIELKKPDDFLLIKETLRRIGICANRSSTLVQTCHIFHKQGKYYITHFKEMYLIDGKQADIRIDDIYRRNYIAKLICSWNLCTPSNFDPDELEIGNAKHTTKIIKHSEAKNWNLVSKHKLGRES